MFFRDIHPPHGVKNRTKFRALQKAYKRKESVPKPVAIDFGSRGVWALSGSHRLAAMKEIYGADGCSCAHVLVLPEANLTAATINDPEARAAMEQLVVGGADVHVVIVMLWEHLPSDAQDLLMDQMVG